MSFPYDETYYFAILAYQRGLALVYGIANTQVVKSVEGKAELVPVKVLARSRDEVLVKADSLAVGDAVVTRGNERVFPGQPLIVLED